MVAIHNGNGALPPAARAGKIVQWVITPTPEELVSKKQRVMITLRLIGESSNLATRLVKRKSLAVVNSTFYLCFRDHLARQRRNPYQPCRNLPNEPEDWT